MDKETFKAKKSIWNKNYKNKEGVKEKTKEYYKEYRIKKLENETPEEKEKRLAKDREYNREYLRKYREKLTPEQLQQKKEYQKKYKAERRKNETPEEKEKIKQRINERLREKRKELKEKKVTVKNTIQFEKPSYETKKNKIFLIKDHEKRKKHFEQNQTDEKVLVSKSSNEVSFLIQDQERRGLILKKSYNFK